MTSDLRGFVWFSGLTPDAVLDKINMTAFVSEAAHQKHDLIRR